MSRELDVAGEPDPLVEVFDAAWEAEARRSVAAAGFDPGLAVRAARDALRVTSGELPEEDFYLRYHDQYMRAFDMDARPVAAGQALAGPPPGAPSGEDAPVTLLPREARSRDARTAAGRDEPPLISRRTAVRAAGAGAAALFLGQVVSAWVPSATADGGAGASHAGGAHTGGGTAPSAPAKASNGKAKVQMGMVVDLEKCDGCLFCVNACKAAYSLADGAHWIYVFAYKEPDTPQDVHLLPRLCNHCSNAPCVKVCPAAARHKRDDGLVLTDYDTCIGCRYCQVACPYGVNYFQWGAPAKNGGGYKGERRDARGRSVVGDPPRGVMGKCTFCPLRQDEQHGHGSTNCALACPHDVLHYGDLNDPQSEPNLYLERRRRESGGKLRTFRLLEDLGTKPNIIYIGNPPSKKAKEVEGPVRYEDWGLVKQRRAVLEGPEPWFRRLVGGQ